MAQGRVIFAEDASKGCASCPLICPDYNCGDKNIGGQLWHSVY
jgi:Pyruvate/2-oxoacid:ferredoxin oxidoreductase delta subunit